MMMIPMEFYKELDNINDISELIDRYVDKDTLDPQVDIPSNMKRNVERSRAVIPKSVTCAPKSTIVPLTPLNGTKDPGVYYYPSCTQVNRCGGCCSSKLTTCQPTETEIINFVIKRIRYAANNRLILDGQEIVLIEEHKACSCGCLIKAEDCNSYQIYDPSRCSCICKLDELHDLVQKCLTEDHKIWDENKCRCVCRDTDTCTTGTIFDENQCKCVESSYAHSKGNSSLSLADRKRFIVKAIPVDPDSS
ncbi:balbiani ring protein 3-like [Teleopsis dalmanni]|uniref:balbiani ring protein 3-like n=1 Tax=Teleopsis dalmanni TaxID=139649 RepID=UPI0018CF291A|nr:balbiani ring protein 3-like [Teleopsis dalmanni]